jgi:hypothetical protein
MSPELSSDEEPQRQSVGELKPHNAKTAVVQEIMARADHAP